MSDAILSQILDRLSAMDGRLTAIEDRLAALNAELINMRAGVMARIDRLQNRFDASDEVMRRMQANVSALVEGWASFEKSFANLEGRIRHLEDKGN